MVNERRDYWRTANRIMKQRCFTFLKFEDWLESFHDFRNANQKKVMRLSDSAIQDLRKELIRLYGTDFNLNEDELNKIGLFLLTLLAEGLKLKKYDTMEELH